MQHRARAYTVDRVELVDPLFFLRLNVQIYCMLVRVPTIVCQISSGAIPALALVVIVVVALPVRDPPVVVLVVWRLIVHMLVVLLLELLAVL